MGVKEACPLGLPPPFGGERGSPSQFPCQLEKPEGISTEPVFLYLNDDNYFLLISSLNR